MRLVLPIVLLTALTAGCAVSGPQGVAEGHRLVVFAAASLADAFTEMGAAFQAAHSGVEVTFNFAGSQSLRTQIEAGAPADVFASANSREMDSLVTDGSVAADAPRIFLSNQLVVILPPDNPRFVGQLRDLANPGLKVVLAVEDVPVGDYARRALEKMDAAYGPEFSKQVLANVVSNEDNVKQVVTKVQLGEADAGIVYSSDAVAAAELKTLDIPPEFNVTALYPIAALRGSDQEALAQSFVEYVLSAAGQAVLRKWGFGPAP